MLCTSQIQQFKQPMNYQFPLLHLSQKCNSSNSGSWSLEENLSFAIFADLNKKSMTSKKKMREMQFYDKLSRFIGSRTESQCRSHHQKLFQKFKYLSKIIELFKSEAGINIYKNKYQQGIQKLKLINQQFQEINKVDNGQNIPSNLQGRFSHLPTFVFGVNGYCGYFLNNFYLMPPNQVQQIPKRQFIQE